MVGTNEEAMEQNILVWMLLQVHYLPLKENNGCEEAFTQQVYSPFMSQLGATMLPFFREFS